MVGEVRGYSSSEILPELGDLAFAGEVEDLAGEVEGFRWELRFAGLWLW